MDAQSPAEAPKRLVCPGFNKAILALPGFNKGINISIAWPSRGGHFLLVASGRCKKPLPWGKRAPGGTKAVRKRRFRPGWFAKRTAQKTERLGPALSAGEEAQHPLNCRS